MPLPETPPGHVLTGILKAPVKLMAAMLPPPSAGRTMTWL